MERIPDSTPLEQLHNLSPDSLTPAHIHAALNYLAPSSAEAIMDAEVVMGYALWGGETYPDDPDWQHAFESSYKVLQHRLTLHQNR